MWKDSERHGEHMSKVREQWAPRKCVNPFSRRSRRLRNCVAASAAAVVVLGFATGRCAAADAAPQTNGVSNGDFVADGRKWTPCALEYGTCRFNGTRDVLYGTAKNTSSKRSRLARSATTAYSAIPRPAWRSVARWRSPRLIQARRPRRARGQAGARVRSPLRNRQNHRAHGPKAPPGQGLRCAAP